MRISQRRVLVLSSIFAFIAVTIFALLAVALAREQLERLDQGGIALVDRFRSPVADAFFTLITWAGSSLVLVPLSVIIAMWYRTQRRHLAAPLMVGPVGAVLLQNVLKPLFGRIRPEAGVLAELGPSFPSGHSMASAAVWLGLAYMLVREQILPKYTLWIALMLALLVGISRVYLGVHWTSDVLAGWSTGLMIAVTSALLYERARRLEQDESSQNAAIDR